MPVSRSIRIWGFVITSYSIHYTKLYELNILALRLGGYKNTAESDIGWVYTAGIGVNMWAARLDIGGAYAADTVEVEGEDVPKELVITSYSIHYTKLYEDRLPDRRQEG